MTVSLDRYRSAKIRHPSWRIYKAIDDIWKSSTDPEVTTKINPKEFGLHPDIQVYYPYTVNDELTDELIAAIVDEDYTDGKYFCIADCMNLFLDVRTRQLLEGMLLQGYVAADIAADLGYKPAFVETYAAAFYDTSVWRTPADKIAYISRGICGEDAVIKRLIQDKGLEYVKVHKYNMPATIKMDKALSTLFGMAYKQAVQYTESGDGEDQHTAQEWIKSSLAIFKELKSAAKSEGGIRELTIALETSQAPKVGIDDLD